MFRNIVLEIGSEKPRSWLFSLKESIRGKAATTVTASLQNLRNFGDFL
jgi:hypothetical protein